MKCYTWDGGKIFEGITFKNDEKLGPVVFLGEEGRGRRYEKISLGRRNPAEAINNKVMEVAPVKITLPAKDGKPEKVFYVLEKPCSEDGRVLVRVNTSWCYTKYSGGGWSTLAGTPETLIKGYGAHGITGRIGNWDDGLVTMKSGDALKVRPEGGNKVDTFVLWVDQNGKPQTATLQDWEILQAVAKAEAMLVEAKAAVDTIPILFGEMPCFTFKSGEIELGIQVEKGVAGLAVKMGEDGRGRKLAEVPLVGDFEIEENRIAFAAVAKLSEQTIPARYSSDKPEKKVIYGLVHSAEDEKGTFLVRVNTSGGYTRRGDGYWETWKGNPEVMTLGSGADGAAGGIGNWKDGLVVLREGDVLFVHPSGGGFYSHALFVEGGKIHCERWIDWKIADGLRDPQFYVCKGTAPWGHIPSEWIGKVVTVLEKEQTYKMGASSSKMYYDHLAERHTGELVSAKPFVLNLGWDDRDRHDITVKSGTWVKLEADKQAKHPEGREANQRRRLRKLADRFRGKAQAAMSKPYFVLLARDLQEKVTKLGNNEEGFDTMATKDRYDSLLSWLKNANQILTELVLAEPAVAALEEQLASGKILANFQTWHRRGGAASKGDGWVIRPDGTLRSADRKEPPYKSDGTLVWDRVEAEELAFSWRQGGSSGGGESNSTYEVVKLPVSDCTEQQLATVRQIEEELGVLPSTFLVTSELQAAAQAVLSVAQKVVAGLVQYPPEFSYHDLANGRVLLENLDRFPTAPIPTANGMLEFEHEYKWGRDNIFVAWRPLTPEEAAAQAARPQQPKPAENVDPLAALRNKWGAREKK
jgi:hypothetical protein